MPILAPTCLLIKARDLVADVPGPGVIQPFACLSWVPVFKQLSSVHTSNLESPFSLSFDVVFLGSVPEHPHRDLPAQPVITTLSKQLPWVRLSYQSLLCSEIPLL